MFGFTDLGIDILDTTNLAVETDVATIIHRLRPQHEDLQLDYAPSSDLVPLF
jgi:hypothetical protein